MSFNFGNTVTNDFSTFSDDEKLNYSLKLALNRVQTWGKTPWYEEPSVLTSTFPNLTLKNKIPESSEIETYYIVDPDLGKATDRNVLKAIASNDYNALTINTIDDSTHNSNPPIRTQSEKQTVNVTNGDTTKTLLKGISKTMIAKYIYWKNYLTGKVTKSDGTTVTDSTSGTGTGTYPDKTAPFASFMTLSNSSGDYYVNDRRVSTIKEGGTYETLFNNLETLYSGLEIIHWSNIENDGTAPPSKRHPFFKVFIGLPTYSTYSDALKEKFNDIGVGSSQSGDNIGFSNRLLERAMGSINGYKFYISTWNKKTSKFKQKKEDTYGDPNNLNILYFLSYSGFILNYGETDILNGKDATIDDASISIKYPPTISFIKYTGETFSDGIISQGETLPAPEVSLPKDLFINTSDDTIYRYNGSAWVSVGGGGGGSINELSDALVENTSIYLGNDPSSTTNTAEYNVAVGKTALDAITTGDRNVAMGYNALLKNTTGTQNVAIGHQALKNNTSGNYNSALGEEALVNNTTARSNTAIGHECMKSNQIAAFNTAIGEAAMKKHISGDNNVVIGREALKDNNTEAGNNVVIGVWALKEGTCGDHNVVIGHRAQYDGGNYNNTICLGYNASVTANNMCKIGNDAMKNVKTSGTITAGSVTYPNTHGPTGQFLKTDGSGKLSWDLPSITGLSDALVENDSIYLGNDPSSTTRIALYNVAVGTTALRNITTGYNNVAVGWNALTSNTTGYENTASGFMALNENISGRYNTASGYQTLYKNTTGTYNTAVGYLALKTNRTGHNNTAIGYGADVTTNNLTNATAIGYDAKVTTNNTIQLGNTAVTNVKTSGNITAGSVTSSGNITAGSVTSNGTVKIHNAVAGGYMYLQVNDNGKAYVLNESYYDLNLGANNNLNQLVLKKNGNVDIENNCFIGVNASITQRQVLQVKAGNRILSFGGYGNNTYIQAHGTQTDGGYNSNAYLTITGYTLKLFGNNDTGITVNEYGNVQATGNITAPSSKFGYISIHHNDEINSDSHLHLQYRTNRNVAIGAVSPDYKLDVDGDIRSFGWLRTNGDTGWYSNSYGGGWHMIGTGWIRSYGGMAVYISGSTSLSWNGYYWSEKSQNYFNGNSNVSLECKHAIVCDWIGANSDRRIKKNIEDIDDGDALKILRKIPVRYYNYIDEMKKGSEKVAGFIAQEVKEHFPIAVSISPYDKAIPNILKKIKNEVWEEKVNETSKNEWILTNFDVIDLNGVISSIDISSNSKYKFFLNDGKDSKEEEIEVLADTDGNFTFEKKWENLFLYGICIDDFHVVDKNKIFAIGFSATQEIDRIQQVEKQKLEELASKITVAESKIATLEAENILLKSRLDSIEAKLQ